MGYILIELFLTSCNSIYDKFRTSRFLLLKDYKVIL